MGSEDSSDTPAPDSATEVIHVFNSGADADLAAANLRAHGIQCWLEADDGGGMLPNLAAYGGIRLSVKSSDAAAGSMLLGADKEGLEKARFEKTHDAMTPPTPVPRTRLAPFQILLGIVVGVLLCLLYQWLEWLGDRTTYEYGANGKAYAAHLYHNRRLIETTRDRNHDGAWDDWAYYQHGRIVREERDNNFDGKPDETWFYSDGETVRMEKDTDFNGVPDEVVTYSNGVPMQMDIMPNGSKYVSVREIYRNAVLVEVLRGGDSNGNFDESVSYDPFYNPVHTNRLR